MENLLNTINDELVKSSSVLQSVIMSESLQDQIRMASLIAIKALQNDGKLFFAGNGGSAADSQHMAGEYVSRFLFDRPGLSAIALTTDTSILTAIGNDYGYEKLFSRQLQALAKPGDVFFAYSTSGTSKNIISAIETAQSLNVTTIGMTGEPGGIMNDFCDITIRVPTESTPKIQELHLIIGHIICQLVERELFKEA